MQIFVIDYVPEQAAAMLCDVHLRKMCLETAQILSAVLYTKNLELQSGMPQPYNCRHPVIAALDTPAKINWTLLHNLALHREYFRRFGKYHAFSPLADSYTKMLFSPETSLQKEYLSFARNFKNMTIPEPDIVKAYRIYYRYKKRVMRRWHYTNAEEPQWLTAF